MDPTLQDVLTRLDKMSGQLEELRDGVKRAGAIADLDPSTPGMETLVLLARETPLPPDVDPQAELGDVRPQASQTLQAMAWFENGAVVRNEPGRNTLWDERTDDPVWATQEQIRRRLGRLFPYTRAVTFAVQGK